MSARKETRDRAPRKSEDPIRRDSPLFHLVEWIAREIVKDAEKCDQPESAGGVVLRPGGAGLPAIVDSTTKE